MDKLTDDTLNTILTLRKQGWPCTQIASHVNRTVRSVQQLVYRHKLSFLVQSSDPCGKRYDWKAVQAFYDEGRSRKECLVKFQMSPNAWDEGRKLGKLQLRPKIPREDFFNAYKVRSSSSLRHHLEKIKWLKNECAFCGVTKWRDLPLVLHIDHIDGDRANNRLDNLRELCPNCHSQTPTYGNKRGAKIRGTSTEAVVRSRIQEGASNLTIAKEVNCSPAAVASIRNGWRRRYV